MHLHINKITSLPKIYIRSTYIFFSNSIFMIILNVCVYIHINQIYQCRYSLKFGLLGFGASGSTITFQKEKNISNILKFKIKKNKVQNKTKYNILSMQIYYMTLFNQVHRTFSKEDKLSKHIKSKDLQTCHVITFLLLYIVCNSTVDISIFTHVGSITLNKSDKTSTQLMN